VEFRQGKRLAKPGDLLQVPGIGPVTVDKIREWFVWDEIDLSDEYQPAVNVPEKSIKQGNLLGNRAGKIKTGDLLLDINTAEIGELIRLPGVGPTLARRVLEERGVKPFSSVDDLMRVPGIGPKTFAKIKSMIKVGSSD
jgi:competence ComEA-like helix-hairpin-helix protein